MRVSLASFMGESEGFRRRLAPGPAGAGSPPGPFHRCKLHRWNLGPFRPRPHKFVDLALTSHPFSGRLPQNLIMRPKLGLRASISVQFANSPNKCMRRTKMSENHGKFVWYELLTTDPEQAAKFYSTVIGWEAKDARIPGVPYTLLSIDGDSAAGLMDMPEPLRSTGANPIWLGYVGVDDVDKIAALATAKGAV